MPPKQLANENPSAALTKSKADTSPTAGDCRKNLPEFEDLRGPVARHQGIHTIENLDFYLEAYEARVKESGGHVQLARTAEDARNIVLEICKSVDAKAVNKASRLISENARSTRCLEENGNRAVETIWATTHFQAAPARREATSIAPAVSPDQGTGRGKLRANTPISIGPDSRRAATCSMKRARSCRQKYFEADKSR